MNKLMLYKSKVIIEFEKTEGLLKLDAVKRFKKSETIFRMSGNFLLAVYDKGHEWLVIGAVFNPKNVDLFDWDGPKERGSDDTNN